jgi:hypothetical protein
VVFAATLVSVATALGAASVEATVSAAAMAVTDNQS